MKYIPLLTKIPNMAILTTKQCYMIWYLATTTNSGLNLLTLLNLILLQTYTSSLHHETKPTYKQTVIESKVSQLAHKLVAKVLVLGTQVTYCMLQWKYEQNLQNQWHIIPLLPAFLAWPDFNQDNESYVIQLCSLFLVTIFHQEAVTAAFGFRVPGYGSQLAGLLLLQLHN